MGAAVPPEFVRLAAHPLRWRLMAELAGGDRRVRELAAELGAPQSLVSYHLRRLRDGGLVRRTRSSFDGRDGYYRLDLDRCAEGLAASGAALHPALEPGAAPAAGRRGAAPVAVLFVCTGNSARSPMAEALLRHRAGGSATVASAGTQPRPRLHPGAVRALRRGFGIDLSGQAPRGLAALEGRRFDHVITLCDRAREACPDLGAARTHWSVPDPAAAGDAGDGPFHRAAAEIEARVRHLLPVLGIAIGRRPEQ
jgi:protein-tyrosine-phosphatase/DNA-binding transcriptional ArsR family regulator